MDSTPAWPTSERERRRAMAGLFLAVAFTATGYIPAVSVAPLVAEDILGDPTWSGLPGAVAIGGAAVGATLLTTFMSWRGRRFGLVLGLGLSAIGAVGAAYAAQRGWLPLFLGMLFLFGVGVVARHLARYVAADLYPVGRSGTAISIVVWGGTIGSVLGPLLLEPAQSLAGRWGDSGLVGPYLLAAAAVGAAMVTLFALVPPGGADPSSTPIEEPEPSPRPTRRSPLLREPRLLFALLALTVGQFVMVLVMAMTPIHIRHAGEGLDTVGLVFAAHTLGMFGLSPLTGFLADRWGRLPVIFVGEIMLLAATLMAAPSHGSERTLLVAALFLLGLGWNFGFVAGSALLGEAAPAGARLRVQGLADTIVWASAAVANLTSGWILAAGGYRTLAFLGAAIVLVPPLAALLLLRRASGGGARRSVPPGT